MINQDDSLRIVYPTTMTKSCIVHFLNIYLLKKRVVNELDNQNK